MSEPPAAILEPLYTTDGYRQYFCNAEFWAPFTQFVCNRHNLLQSSLPHSGLPGTFPTFIVSDRWVVKFFGPLFDGLTCFQIEQTANQILSGQDLPIPGLLASGYLFPPHTPGFPWPYLVYEYIAGSSIGEVYSSISYTSKRALAAQLGCLLKRIHGLPLRAGSILAPNWDSYQQLITRQIADCLERHSAWGSLPGPLLAGIPAYLVPPDGLIPAALAPSLIHADLTRDHLLGDLLPGGDWRLNAIIDYGDALSGDLFYELVVLHLEIFDADLGLLQTFLEAYQPSSFHRQQFAHKAMTITLLHNYDPFATLFERQPRLLLCTSLEELSGQLWKVNFGETEI